MSRMDNLLTLRNTDVDETGDIDYAGRAVVWWGTIINDNAAAMYVKFYDKVTGAVAADAPKFVVKVGIGLDRQFSFPQGVRFNLGISMRAATVLGDAGNTGPGDDDVMVTLAYEPLSQSG